MAALIMEMKKRIPAIIFKESEKKYVTAGDRACRMMMLEARRQRLIRADDQRIMARAMVDLGREIAEGFWERKAV